MQLNFQSKLLTAKQDELLQTRRDGLPEGFFKDLMNDQLGRGYLNHLPAVHRARGEGKTFSMRLKLNLELSESSRLTANAEIVSEKIFNGSKEYFQMNL